MPANSLLFGAPSLYHIVPGVVVVVAGGGGCHTKGGSYTCMCFMHVVNSTRSYERGRERESSRRIHNHLHKNETSSLWRYVTPSHIILYILCGQTTYLHAL